MGLFTQCGACRRHYRRTDAACPFCASAQRLEGGAHAGRTSRAGRLLLKVMVGATAAPLSGCGSTAPDAAHASASPPDLPSTSLAPSSAPSEAASTAPSAASASPPEGLEPPVRRIAIYGSTEIVIVPRVAFDMNSAVLLPESAKILDEIAALMKANPQLYIAIEARADTTETNVDALAKARAAGIVAYLRKVGAAADHLRERPIGSTKPLGDPTTQEGRVQNRSTTFKAENEDGSAPG